MASCAERRIGRAGRHCLSRARDSKETGPTRQLGIDLTPFKKVRGDADVPSHYKYVDEEAGVTIDFNGDGATETVRACIYQPQAKYRNLRCAEPESRAVKEG